MSFKPFAIASLLLAGTTSWAALDSSTLSQCQQLAAWTPSYIYENTNSGATKELYTLAQNCFINNACASMTDVDKLTCARSIALNSYLINVAYRSQRAAEIPYPSISTTLNRESTDAETTSTATESSTIKWS